LDDEAHGYEAVLLLNPLPTNAKCQGLEGEADGLIEGDDNGLAKDDTEGNFVGLLLGVPAAIPRSVAPVEPVETVLGVPAAPNTPAGPAAPVSPAE